MIILRSSPFDCISARRIVDVWFKPGPWFAYPILDAAGSMDESCRQGLNTRPIAWVNFELKLSCRRARSRLNSAVGTKRGDSIGQTLSSSSRADGACNAAGKTHLLPVIMGATFMTSLISIFIKGAAGDALTLTS